jgi:hypothetical protein
MESLMALWLWDPLRAIAIFATLIVLFVVPACVTPVLRFLAERRSAGARRRGSRPRALPRRPTDASTPLTWNRRVTASDTGG